MKALILKRPLMFAVIFSILVALLCAYADIYILVAIAVGLLFSIFLAFSFKGRFKEFFILSFSLAFLISVSTILYYFLNYLPCESYKDKTVDANCVIVSSEENSALLYCVSTLDGERMGFFTNAYFEENTSFLPSTKISAKISFYSLNDIGNCYTAIYLDSKVSDCEVTRDAVKTSPLYLYYQLRQKVGKAFDVPDEDTAAFLNGMLLGDKDNISGVFSNKLRIIGLSHILSVSGLHLMLAVLFLEFLLIFFGVNYKIRAIISIAVSLSFTIVSGFAVSCIRAFVMLTIYYLARMIDECHDSLTSLSVSAYLLLLFTPANILDVSYVLTMLATFGLIVFTPILNSLIPLNKLNFNRFVSFLLHLIRNMITVSFAVNIMCLPVFVFAFKQVSIVSPLSNLLLALPIQLLFYCGFILLFFGWIPSVHILVGKCAVKIYDLIEICVDGIYNVENITVSDGYPLFYSVFILLCILMLGIVAFNVFKSINTAYPYIIAYTLICFSLFILNLFVNYDKVDVNFVNVGHGNATVITQKENAVVVDCGGDSYDGLFSVLRRRNVKRIELLALTHLDFDHTNFVSYLINNYEIGKIIYPNFCDPKKIKDILKNINAKTEVLPLNDDVCIKVLDDSELYVFVQKANEYVIKSNTSALYKFVHGQTSVCLTGDMTISQENKYLEYGSELDCDILLAAHHGSPSSSLKRILDVYTPEYSVISASEQHKYGLPDERIVKRLAEYSEVLFTYDYSNIRFTLNRKGYKITYE